MDVCFVYRNEVLSNSCSVVDCLCASQGLDEHTSIKSGVARRKEFESRPEFFHVRAIASSCKNLARDCSYKWISRMF